MKPVEYKNYLMKYPEIAVLVSEESRPHNPEYSLLHLEQILEKTIDIFMLGQHLEYTWNQDGNKLHVRKRTILLVPSEPPPKFNLDSLFFYFSSPSKTNEMPKPRDFFAHLIANCILDKDMQLKYALELSVDKTKKSEDIEETYKEYVITVWLPNSESALFEKMVFETL